MLTVADLKCDNVSIRRRRRDLKGKHVCHSMCVCMRSSMKMEEKEEDLGHVEWDKRLFSRPCHIYSLSQHHLHRISRPMKSRRCLHLRHQSPPSPSGIIKTTTVLVISKTPPLPPTPVPCTTH